MDQILEFTSPQMLGILTEKNQDWERSELLNLGVTVGPTSLSKRLFNGSIKGIKSSEVHF